MQSTGRVKDGDHVSAVHISLSCKELYRQVTTTLHASAGRRCATVFQVRGTMLSSWHQAGHSTQVPGKAM